tara:strand:- start:1133 stop:1639 length:507 start_codon:yes stop_codon:yes gene_type:complete
MASILNVDKIRATGSTTDALTVDSSGRVFTPARPGFRAGSNGNQNAVTGIVIYNEDTDTNFGQYNTGMYNKSTGKVTIPVSGVYFHSAQAYADGSNQCDLVMKYQPGGTGTAYDYDAHYEDGSQNIYPTMHLVGTGKLNAGDVLYVHVNGGQAHLNGNKSHFQMYLVG